MYYILYVIYIIYNVYIIILCNICTILCILYNSIYNSKLWLITRKDKWMLSPKNEVKFPYILYKYI